MDYNANMNRLRYFQEVCRQESVTRAAIALNISQPSVTIAIRELEESLGVILFNRHKNRLKLTEDGKVLWEKTNELFENINHFFLEAKDMGLLVNTKVNIGIPPIIGIILIPLVYSAVRKEYPDITLKIIECTMSDAIAMLDKHEIDIAILLHDDILEHHNYKIFYETEIQFCINKNHPFAQKKSITGKELADFPLAILSSGSYHYTAVINFFEKQDIKPNIILQSLEQRTVSQLVENFEMGTFTYKDVYINDPSIVTIPCVPKIPASLCAVWSSSNYITNSTEKLLKYLVSKKWL